MSHYLLIPFIFSGITLLAVLVTYHVLCYSHSRQMDIATQVFWLGLGAVIVSFVCSLLIVRFILKPITQFVKKAESLPVVSQTAALSARKGDSGEIEHLHEVLHQVTAVLSKIEARELFPDMVGQSRTMRSVFSQILKVAPEEGAVLLSGETGTGKELVATSIYEHSRRAGKAFIKINCVAIPEGLLESELFGHEKGAFTGAIAQKIGKFEMADGGTVFLDEIGDMPMPTQAKLLRVLQEKEFQRVGGTQNIKVDIRFIAATNKNLSEMIKAGTFRQDLFYRLNVFTIHLPPLRERLEDIPLLIEFFLRETGREIKVSPKAMQMLLEYPWPGNIRELRNVITWAAAFAEETIEPVHIATKIKGQSTNGDIDVLQPLDARLAEIEKGMIINALTRAGYVQTRAAQILGINPRSLLHRIKKYGIDIGELRKLQNL